MNAMRRLLGFALITVFAALPATAFEPEDITGSWYAMGMEAKVGGHDPVLVEAWVYVTFDSLATSGTWTTYGDSAPPNVRTIEGGSLAVDSAGLVNGTLELSGGDTIAIENFQMNEGMDFVSGVTTPSPTAPGLLTMVKEADGYSDADLTGDWKVFGFYEKIVFPYDSGFIEGLLALSKNAETDSGGYLFSEHEEIAFIAQGIELTLTATGKVTFDPTHPRTLPGSLRLQLSSGKNLMIGRGIGWELAGESQQRLYLLIKESAGLVPADLAGTWHTSTFFDSKIESDPGNGAGRLTVDKTGAEVLRGGFVYNDGSTSSLAGGSITPIGEPGRGSYLDLQYVGGMSSSGELHQSSGSDVIFGYTTADALMGGDSTLYAAVKVPEASTGLLGLASLLSLATLRRNRRR